MSAEPSETHPAHLAISDYTYDLPDERIARYPLVERDTSKLLVYREGRVEEQVFHQLPDLLQPKDCLVFNDTRVIHARLHLQRPTGAHMEVLCLEPVQPVEITEAFAQTERTVWRALVRNGKRWQVGTAVTKEIVLEGKNYTLQATLKAKEADSALVEFLWDQVQTFAEVLDDVGILPLPPYLNRETKAEDEERYQTLYAQAKGSVAAPTAGLHFTPRVFDDLQARQVQPIFVTLHVGAGTFKPVKAATMKGHQMHRERIAITRKSIEKMRAAAESQRIVAVGTTSLRTIESLYWFGVKLHAGADLPELEVGQWDPYELAGQALPAAQALDAVLAWMQSRELTELTGQTQLLIAPGYTIRMAHALITNFHQPNSTLLLLVAAFIGPDWRKVYDHALAHDFRFLSFGDSSILFKS